MAEGNPKLTVIVASYNTGKFLRATLDSILGQTYKNFECVVIDGGSSDGTLEILKDYAGIKWISEKDSGYLEAFRKGLALARGEYVAQCAVSDGYLRKTWFAQCAEVLDTHADVSLVWGLPRYMSEDGRLLAVSYPQFHRRQPPQKEAFFYYWLRTQFWLPEGNFVVRKRVMEECFPPRTANAARDIETWLEFNLAFHTRGYLPYFLPVVANYGRIHDNQLGAQELRSGVADLKFKRYLRECRKYRMDILCNRQTHMFRNGEGILLPIRFSHITFFLEQIFHPRAMAEILLTFTKRVFRAFIRYSRVAGVMPKFMDAYLERRRRRALERPYKQVFIDE